MNRQFWIKILFIEGFFLGGLGLGWAFGVWSGSMSPTMWALVIAGVLSLSTAFTLWAAMRPSGTAVRRPLRGVDLDQSFRAARAYGWQPPLVEGDNVRSHLLAVQGEKKIEAPAGTEAILEHWDGPELHVASIEGRVRLAPRQILRLSPGGMPMYLRPVEASGEGMVLVHFVQQPRPE